MSRWQPPYPAKTIATENPRPERVRGNNSRHVNCCWPGCQSRDRHLPGIPLCFDHATKVIDANDKRTGQDLQTLAQREYDRLAREDAELRARAQARRRAPGDYTAPEGTVYYVLVGQHIKIGYTANMNRRLRAYPPDSTVLGVEWGGKDLERQRHHQFEAHRALGREWFTDCEEIREHIESACMAWSPSIRPAAGPSGPRRAHIGPRYGTWDTKWKAS